jgi:hypothetical protein
VIALSEAAVLRTQRNNLLARVLDLEVEVALLQDELQRLRRGPAATIGQKLWLWNGADHFLAYAHEFPCDPDGGDPLPLGQPVGVAVLQDSGAAQNQGLGRLVPRQAPVAAA